MEKLKLYYAGTTGIYLVIMMMLQYFYSYVQSPNQFVFFAGNEVSMTQVYATILFVVCMVGITIANKYNLINRKRAERLFL